MFGLPTALAGDPSDRGTDASLASHDLHGASSISSTARENPRSRMIPAAADSTWVTVYMVTPLPLPRGRLPRAFGTPLSAPLLSAISCPLGRISTPTMALIP